VSHYQILDGNPPDEQQWKPSLKAHQTTFKHPPREASADRALSFESDEELARQLGVRRVIIPKRGYRSKPRERLEHRTRFVKGRHWHAGVGGRISVLKRAHGPTGFHQWVGWGNALCTFSVIAGNLAVLGRL